MNNTKTNTVNNSKFTTYLNNLFTPAQNWASGSGRKWIQANIQGLDDLIIKNYNDCLFGIYCIRINDIPLYIGESIKPVKRLVVHAYNLCHHPEIFGLKSSDITSNRLSVELLETSLYREDLRKAKEVSHISSLHPLLQRCDGSDFCIPRNSRTDALLPHLN